MICPLCGKEIPDGSTVCPICGVSLETAAEAAAPVVEENAAPVVEEPAAAPVVAEVPQPVTVAEVLPMPKNVKEFLKQRKDIPEYGKMRKEINSAAILFYVFAAITAVVNVLIAKNPAGLLDVGILLALGLWLHVKYSRTAAIVALVYSLVNMIYIVTQTGKLGGYLIVIIAVIAVIYTFKAASEFKKFKENANKTE